MARTSYDFASLASVLLVTLGHLTVNIEAVYSCKQCGLTGVPTDIPLDVTEVELAYNAISEVPMYAFSEYTQLTSLGLSNNGISFISSEAFRDCPIEELHLVGNVLNAHSLMSLIPLSHTLKTLDLSAQPSIALDEETLLAFRNFTALQHLSLRASEYTDFPTIDGLQLGLTNLDFRGNRFSVIEKKSLAMLPMLQILQLDNNELTSFPDIRDTEIGVLKLRGNPLICDETIAWMKNLQCSSVSVILDQKPCTSPSNLVGLPWSEIGFADLILDIDDLDGFSASMSDGNDSTCIDAPVGHKTFLSESILGYLTCKIKINIVGQNLDCWDNGEKPGLQFFVNKGVGSHDSMYALREWKRCSVDHSEPGLCQFECDCSADIGGCQEGLMYWPRMSSDFHRLICELSIE